MVPLGTPWANGGTQASFSSRRVLPLMPTEVRRPEYPVVVPLVMSVWLTTSTTLNPIRHTLCRCIENVEVPPNDELRNDVRSMNNEVANRGFAGHRGRLAFS
jgi:hypothetical protein